MTLRLGMSGAYVKSVQEFLTGLQLYRGPIDSSYGGGTYSAVKNFQLRHGLQPTGTVDSATWAAMFPGVPAPVSDLPGKPLSDRCLALTGSFETSSYPPDSFCGLSGDFDHMGLSFGVCQWNIGQGTLQPLLVRMFDEHPEVARSIFHENTGTLASLRAVERTEQLAFVRSIQDKGQFVEPWRGMLLSLGRTAEFQSIQCDAAAHSFQAALRECRRFGLKTERAVAFMFDVVTQNGSIDVSSTEVIQRALKDLAPGQDNEPAILTIVANQVAQAASAEHAADVRMRKLAIAEGAGVVHGRYYDLEEMFGIRLAQITI